MKYLILAALFALAVAQETRFPEFSRPCSERSALVRPQVKTAFNVAAYSGTWFEISRYQQQDELETDCGTSSYSWSFINRLFQIARLDTNLEDGNFVQGSATALLSFPDQSPTLGLMNVTAYANRTADEVNYYVLGTDYFQYAIGWACEAVEGPDGEEHSREFAWIYSRTPELPEEYNERVDDYIERFFDREFIRDTVQDTAACMGDAATREIRLNWEAKKMQNKK